MKLSLDSIIKNWFLLCPCVGFFCCGYAVRTLEGIYNLNVGINLYGALIGGAFGIFMIVYPLANGELNNENI